MGGEKLAALKTIRIEVEIGQWDPGASFTLGRQREAGSGQVEAGPDAAISPKGTARNEWDASAADGGRPHLHRDRHADGRLFDRQRRGRRPSAEAHDHGASGQPEHTMSGRRLTATLREMARLTVIQDMKAHPDRVTALPNQVGGTRAWPALQLSRRLRRLHRAVQSGHEPPHPRALEGLGRTRRRRRIRSGAHRLARRERREMARHGAHRARRHEGPRVQGHQYPGEPDNRRERVHHSASAARACGTPGGSEDHAVPVDHPAVVERLLL